MDRIDDDVTPAVIHWPRDEARRADLARDGVPCLIVVPPGVAIPVVGPGEDWVRASADERELAARLRQLAAVGRSAGSPVPPLIPADLAGPARRVAERLAAAPEGLVRRDELAAVAAPGPVARAVAGARTALAPAGWSIDPVPGVGWVLARVDQP